MTDCCIKGCNKRVLAKGMCAMHYARMRKYGDPSKVLIKQVHGLSLEQRFFSYVQKGDACWEWSGYRDVNGYGRLNIDGRPVLAHRIAWSIHTGADLNSDEHLLHKCDNPKCVRPDHLIVGDQVANNADMMAKGRFRPGHVYGERHGGAVLTESQVREIRASDEPQEMVAERYGVSRRTIRDIRANRSWTHLK